MLKISYLTTLLSLLVLGSINAWAQSSSEGTSVKDYVEEINMHRAEKDKSFKDKKETPFKKKKDRRAFKKLDYFPADDNYALSAEVIPFPEVDTLIFPTSAGTEKSFLRWAILRFELEGKTLELEAYSSLQNINHPVYSNYLFVPFTDLCSSEECYGGGRYLDLQIPEGDHLELDFNYAYNPLCAYSEGWFCPIPPRQNHLDFYIAAGEQNYESRKSKKH
jgi:uncharacterized protein (DUF1684 family)